MNAKYGNERGWPEIHSWAATIAADLNPHPRAISLLCVQPHAGLNDCVAMTTVVAQVSIARTTPGVRSSRSNVATPATRGPVGRSPLRRRPVWRADRPR
jgi:hypothetical protein